MEPFWSKHSPSQSWLGQDALLVIDKLKRISGFYQPIFLACKD